MDLFEMQQRQIEDAQNEKIYQRQVQALRDRSKIAVASGEAGVGGASVERLINFYEMDEAHDVQNIERNKEMQLQQSAMEARSSVRNAQSAINQAEREKDQQTTDNPWGRAILRGLPSIVSGWASHKYGNDE